MKLTKEQEAILNGEKGETLAKVMKTLVMYGEAFGADKMVEVTSKYNHLVTSFGLGVMKPVYELMDKLLILSPVPATCRKSATRRKKAMCCPGRNLPLSSTPIRYWAPDATVTPASST